MARARRCDARFSANSKEESAVGLDWWTAGYGVGGEGNVLIAV